MRIKQLIKELQKYNPNSKVACMHINAANGWCRDQICGIRELKYTDLKGNKCTGVDIIYGWK